MPNTRASSASASPPRGRAASTCSTASTTPRWTASPCSPDQARGVQIDLDPIRIGLRYPVKVGLIGDSRASLRELLLPLLKRNENRGFLQKAQEGMRDWWQLMEERATRPDKPMKPQVVKEMV